MSTSTHLPLCVYCGTARSADESRCPHCGRPWIDVRVGSTGAIADQTRVPATVGARSIAAESVVNSTRVENPAPAEAPITDSPIEDTALTETTPEDAPAEDTLTEAVSDDPPAEADTVPEAVSDDSPAEVALPTEPTPGETSVGETAVTTTATATIDGITGDVASVGEAATQAAEADADVVPPPPVVQGEEGPTADPSQRFVWLIPALIAGSAVIVITLFAFGFLDGETEPTTAPVAATVPIPTTAAPTTTTQAPTTTAVPSTTTTSTTIPEPADIEPVGDAIPMSSLTLKAGGIGPLVVGDAAPDAIGRLVASLGRPEATGLADEEFGLCAGEDGRYVRWAGLTVVVSGTLQDGVFAGYRFEEQAVPTMHLDLATPSGIRVGDPLTALNEVYAAYHIDYVSDGGASLFRLSDEEGLLLWGPVSSIEDSGRIEGIYSPDACSSQGR